MFGRRLTLSVCSVLLLAACGRDDARPVTLVAPSSVAQSVPPALPVNQANWTAEATVVSRTDGGHGTCGWGTEVGATRAGVDWRITSTGESILLEEDMRNWPTDHIPYSGTLTGVRFTATYSQGSDYLRWICQFKGGTLTGNFSADFSSFEALETLVWGPPGQETTVQRRWVGSR